MGRNTTKRRASVNDDSGSEVGAPVAKKSKSGPSSSQISDVLKDDDGNPFWQVCDIPPLDFVPESVTSLTLPHYSCPRVAESPSLNSKRPFM